jgi:hypothetical protein
VEIRRKAQKHLCQGFAKFPLGFVVVSPDPGCFANFHQTLAFARHWRRTSGALRQAGDKKINYAAGNRQGLATGKKNIPVKIASPATGPKPYFEHWSGAYISPN